MGLEGPERDPGITNMTFVVGNTTHNTHHISLNALEKK